MKKALALVLALVLALSMAVSAFAADVFVNLTDVTPSTETVLDPIPVVDAGDKTVLYTDAAGTYYVALEDKAYTDVVVTANGNVSAKLIDYDPEKHNVTGMDINYAITRKGEIYAINGGNYYTYAEVLAQVEMLNKSNPNAGDAETTYYGYKLMTNVNIIEITVEDNYGVHYTEGEIKISAKLGTSSFVGYIDVINDVTIFEYEEVKWTAANFADKAALTIGQGGYSDFATAENGYGATYEEEALRNAQDAAVISTTAFRAITGKNIKLVDPKGVVSVVLENVSASQKGVNFKYQDFTFYNEDGVAFDPYSAEGKKVPVETIEFGFLGDQKVYGDFVLTATPNLTYYQLRELFKEKVEEDDIISYYLLKDGKLLKEYKIDYMTVNPDAQVEIELELSNTTLGMYQLVMEVPSVETESNPNTGAESVVGVVAALAVVSLASAAAVSLKK